MSVTKEQKRLQEQINALIREQVKITEELENTEGHYNASLDKALSISQKLLLTSTERKQMAQNENNQLQEKVQKEISLAQAKEEELKKQIELLKMEAVIDQDAIAAATVKLDLAKENQAEHKKTLVTLGEQSNSLSAQKEVSEKSVSAFGSIASNLGISRSETAGMVKGMASAYIEAVKVDGVFMGTVKTIGSLAMAFWDVFNPVSIISSLMEKIMTASIEFMHTSSAALANFSKSAGDAGAMASDVSGAMNLGTGVNITEVAQAASGLAGSWNEMSDAASSTRRMVIRTGAELERMGWSAEAYGKSITYMQSALGMSAEEGAKAMKGLASAAHGLGM